MNYQPNQQKKRNFQAGFTLIELLVVIFIIGILITLAVASLADSRAKARDITRVSDVRQMQSALELYFYNKNSFPVANNITLGSENYNVFCDTEAGFQGTEDGCSAIYFKKLPLALTPPADNSYIYNSSDGKNYTIVFTLEKETGTLSAGEHTATPEGIQ
ncbi:MAG: type II secretion system GspH family protein [Methanoregula sp.]|nr:type II secretion system GspH family protein [Methanoregula sp.]